LTYPIGMFDAIDGDVTVLHGGTAAALSHILPVLLLALLVEVRRARPGWCRRTPARVLVGCFLLCFGALETLFVISIDGSLTPYRWSDLLAALVIFVLLGILFALSLTPAGDGEVGDGGAAPRR